MKIKSFKTSEKRLEQCGWQYRHQDDLDNEVFSRIINGIGVTVTLCDDDEAEVHVNFEFVRRAIPLDDFVTIGNEIKKLEIK